MILSTHIVAGAAIALQIQNPALGLILAFFSNYLLDSLPHSEYSVQNLREHKWKKSFLDFLKVGFDLLFGFSIILLFSKNYLIALTGGFFAILPDGLTFLLFLFPNNKILEKHFKFHEATHLFNTQNISFLWKTISQVAVVLIAVYFLK